MKLPWRFPPRSLTSGARWQDQKLPAPFVVVLGQGSVELLTRVTLAAGRKMRRPRGALITMDERGLKYFFVLRQDLLTRSYYVLLPATEIIG